MFSLGSRLTGICSETRSWDVRTKRVTYDVIPTIDGVIGITNYGPSATLFTLGRDYTVQQYDVNPAKTPLQVATQRHDPSDYPIELPSTSQALKMPEQDLTSVESSADEGGSVLSPVDKIASRKGPEALHPDHRDELRDTLMPLSPGAYEDSLSSHSSTRSRRTRKYLYDLPGSSRSSTTSGYDGTEFSLGGSRLGHESMSIRSYSTHGRHRSSNLRNQLMRSPGESDDVATMDLFPHIKARLANVALRTPHYGEGPRTAELLLREMLSVVFGWNDDIRSLIHEELSHHRPGSASAVLLRRWLGDMGAESMASLVGSESMTSSDWMMLALSSIGVDSQKKVGEAFVQRLLEKGDVHPAVAILLGLGECNDAIEVYVSQGFHMEAVLLTSLYCPSDWQRVSHLIRKWGEVAIQASNAELAARCFSCASVETSVPWRSPGAQDAVFVAQQDRMTRPPSAGAVASPTFSIPSRSASGRLKNASLKLITTFGEKGVPILAAGDTSRPITALTPIATSALPSALPLSPGAEHLRPRVRASRDPSSARTATPGGYARRKRLPSRSEIERAKQEAAEMATPITAARDLPPSRTSSRASGARTPSISSALEPVTAVRPSVRGSDELAPYDRLPSPTHGVFNSGKEARMKSRDRKGSTLAVEVKETTYIPSPHPGTNTMSLNEALHSGTLSPPLTGGSSKASARGRATETYINSVEEARLGAKKSRNESRRRGESRRRETRAGQSSRTRDVSESRGRNTPRLIKPAKRSPSSPVPMSPEEIAQASHQQYTDPPTTDDENFYKADLASPVESQRSGRTAKSEPRALHRRVASEDIPASSAQLNVPKPISKSISRKNSPDPLTLAVPDERGRSDERAGGSLMRSLSSPASPLPMLSSMRYEDPKETARREGSRSRPRRQSSSQRADDDLQSRRQASRDRRDRSASRRRPQRDENGASAKELMKHVIFEEDGSYLSQVTDSCVSSNVPARSILSDTSVSALWSDDGSRLSKKQMAAKELEERRKSLARRPSAPQIPLPGESARPSLFPRSNTDLGDSPVSYHNGPLPRSQSVDPVSMSKGAITGMSTPSAPIGLPATPRAMRHPRYMSSDPSDRDNAPPVPDIPGLYSDIGSLSGSALSQVTGSNLSYAPSSLLSGPQRSDPGRSNISTVSSYLSNQRSDPGRMSQISSSLLSNSYRPDFGQGSYLSQAPSMVSSTERSDVTTSTDAGVPVGPLLPSTVFGQPSRNAPPRSASVPLESLENRGHPAFRGTTGQSSNRNSGTRTNVRKISPRDSGDASDKIITVASIDAALHDNDDSHNIVIVPENPDLEQAVLPELQHLADMPIPPPPPPPPQPLPASILPPVPKKHSGMISIAMDDEGLSDSRENQGIELPQPAHRTTTVSPSTHRRNVPSGGESLGSRFRGLGDRMRSSSKSRTKSPSVETKPLPYETVLPQTSMGHGRRESFGRRAQSPYEQAMAAADKDAAARQNNMVPQSPSIEQRLNEYTIPPSSLPGARNPNANIYRNPREIRANMPPDQVQNGVYNGSSNYL